MNAGRDNDRIMTKTFDLYFAYNQTINVDFMCYSYNFFFWILEYRCEYIKI